MLRGALNLVIAALAGVAIGIVGGALLVVLCSMTFLCVQGIVDSSRGVFEHLQITPPKLNLAHRIGPLGAKLAAGLMYSAALLIALVSFTRRSVSHRVSVRYADAAPLMVAIAVAITTQKGYAFLEERVVGSLSIWVPELVMPLMNGCIAFLIVLTLLPKVVRLVGWYLQQWKVIVTRRKPIGRR